MGSLLSQLVHDVAEGKVDLKLLPPHASKCELKLAKFIFSAETNQPHSFFTAMVIRLQRRRVISDEGVWHEWAWHTHYGTIERERLVHTDSIHLCHTTCGHQLDRLVYPVFLKDMELRGKEEESGQKRGGDRGERKGEEEGTEGRGGGDTEGEKEEEEPCFE